MSALHAHAFRLRKNTKSPRGCCRGFIAIHIWFEILDQHRFA